MTMLCNAENEHGTQSTDCVLTIATKHGEDKHLVTVEDSPPTEKEKPKKPKFTRKPAPKITVNEGTKVEMTAKAIGHPNPVLKWTKDGKEISRTNKACKIWLTGSGESVLEIECAVLKSAAKFTCIATNSEGSDETETELIVQRKKHVTLQTIPVPPKFIYDLTDIGITSGHPATLKCKITGDPEPLLRWFFVDDQRKSIPVSEMKPSVWTEYREGEKAELRANAVFKLEQGTYQCIATNEKGTAMSACYLLVGDSIDDAPAGPPRFVHCLRDIWVPLGEKVEMGVEVNGEPMPEMRWYHNDEVVVEGRDYKISYPSPNKSLLTIPSMSLIHMGRYSVEASNVHGIVRTNASLMIGNKLEHSEPPSFSQQPTEPIIVQSPKPKRKADSDEPPLSPNDPKRIKSQIQKKGAAPSFVIGLADMELKAGDTAAVAGKLAKKRRHRHGDDPQSLKDAIIAKLHTDGDDDNSSPRSPLSPLLSPAPLASTSRRHTGETTLEEIRQAINKRNKRICRPKFLVKPKPKKSIEEFKSLRLKAALSGNPAPAVVWNREGVILETGNKFSIYNDGDFYYLEVHHFSSFDQGFYNCTATNAEGFDICTSEIEIETKDSPMDKLKKRLRRESVKPTFIEVLPGRMKVKCGETLSLECSVSGYPSPKIQWQRNGVTLIPQTTKARYSMFYDGECATLTFDALTPSDIGTYTLQCENSAGTATTQVNLEIETPTIIIEKTTGSDGIPPKFTNSKQKLTKTNVSEIKLKAEISEGTEPINIRWILNKVEIQDSPGFKYSRNGKTVILSIKDAFPEDSGIYMCIAENKFGTGRCYIDLQISEQQKPLNNKNEEPPKVQSTTKLIAGELGGIAEIRFTVTGKPEPVISWYKSEQQILPDSRHETISDGNQFILRIRDLQATDAGNYFLEAVNSAGSSKETVTLNISEISTHGEKKLPKFTKLPVSIQCTLGQSAKFECEFEGEPIPSTNWFLESKRLQTGHGIYILSTPNSSQLLISKVEEQHLGEYLCTVRNNYGEDLATAVLFLEGTTAALRSPRSPHPPSFQSHRLKTNTRK